METPPQAPRARPAAPVSTREIQNRISAAMPGTVHGTLRPRHFQVRNATQPPISASASRNRRFSGFAPGVEISLKDVSDSMSKVQSSAGTVSSGPGCGAASKRPPCGLTSIMPRSKLRRLAAEAYGVARPGRSAAHRVPTVLFMAMLQPGRNCTQG